MMRFLAFTTLICCLITPQVRAEDAATGPFAPDVAREKFVLNPDCQIELVAAEPHVIDPVAVAFGPDGKLWVVEYSDYPNGPEQGQPGMSRIRVLEDRDGDGRYESSRIFAEKLLFANGLLLWKNGVIVTTDGKILFLCDHDGDGRADESQIWFQGFKVENPQLRCNHPTLGIDNKIYVANGLRGGEIVPGPGNPWKLDPDSAPVSLSGMDFRFDPLTGHYEAISGMGQFGLTFDDWGNRFVCENRHPNKQIVLEDGDIKRVPWLQPRQVSVDVSPAENLSRLSPISRTWTTSNLHANQFTAACGVQIYRGHALPAAYYGNSFTCEPTANLIHRDILRAAPATYRALLQTGEKEFLATRDEWFRPVNLTIGPDGALYICDMYRAVIEHPQFMPEELRHRPDLLLGNDMGRIWRVRARASSIPETEPAWVQPMSSKQLVLQLKHSNPWQRETAQRLLLERQDSSIEADLAALVLDKNSHWGGPHALWTLTGLHRLKIEHIAAGFKHPYAGRAAVQLAAQHFPDSKELLEFPQAFLTTQDGNAKDPHLFEQILVNTSWKNFPVVAPGASLLSAKNPRQAALLKIPQDGEHEWYCSMLVINAGEELVDVCEALLTTLRLSEELVQPLLQAGPQSIDFLSSALARRHQAAELQQYLGVVFQPAESVKARSWQRAALAGLLRNFPNGQTQIPVQISQLSGDVQTAYTACLQEILDSSRELGTDLQLDQLPLLMLLPTEQVLPVLKQLAASSNLDHVNAAIDLFRRLPGSVAVPELAQLLTAGTPQIRRGAISALSASREGIVCLLDAVEEKTIASLEIDPAISKRLMGSRDPAIKTRAAALLRQSPPEDRVKVLAEYAAALTLPSDPRKGKIVFEKNCAICHRIGETGVNVAPDISDSRTKTSDFLLTNILDPNRAVDNNYFSFTIVDTNGLVHTGVISSETSTAVTLKQAEGKTVTISRDEIDAMKNNGVSLMPVGLERTVSVQEMADLISFVKNWRYLDGQAPGEVIQIVGSN